MNSTASRSSSADKRHDEPRPISVADVTYRATTFVYETPPRTQVQVAHDRKKGLFRVTDPRGATAVFQDRPVRFLVVQPDSRTGNMAPVVACGEAKYLYLCRERPERPSGAKPSRKARRSRNGAAQPANAGSRRVGSDKTPPGPQGISMARRVEHADTRGSGNGRKTGAQARRSNHGKH
jgi:hypothetical protein